MKDWNPKTNLMTENKQENTLIKVHFKKKIFKGEL